MKKLIGLLIVVGAFLVPDAEARFKGHLQQRTPWILEVTSSSTNGGSTAVQVTAVKRNGRQVLLGTLTLAPGDSGTLGDEVVGFPESVRRIVIEVDPPAGGGAVVTVTQGLSVFEDPVSGDERFVFDLDPTPRFTPAAVP